MCIFGSTLDHTCPNLKRADTHVTQFGILTRFEQGWQSKNFWLFLTREQGKTIETFVLLSVFSELLPSYWFTIGISAFNEILFKQLQGEWINCLLGCIYCAILILISCNSGCQPKVHCFCCCRTTKHQSFRGLCKILIAKGESSTKYNKW